MVDKALVAAKVAAVRDATARVRAVLPPSAEAFAADRTAREVVILNLLVAIQSCLGLATHWLADAGWEVPTSYAAVFTALDRHNVIDAGLATQLAGPPGSATSSLTSTARSTGGACMSWHLT